MLQRVLNKMPQGKVKKAKLSTAKPMKVNLNKIDDLNKEWFDTISSYKATLDAYKKGMNDAIGYLDELRSIAVDFYSINAKYREIYEQMMELGVDANEWMDEISSRVHDWQMPENRIDEITDEIPYVISDLEEKIYLFETK